MNYLANLHNSLRSVSAIPWRTADNKDRTFEAHTGGGQRSNHTCQARRANRNGRRAARTESTI